jgi:hypothetical protein
MRDGMPDDARSGARTQRREGLELMGLEKTGWKKRAE